MLRDLPWPEAVLIDILLGVIWHFASFFLCISVSRHLFNPARRRYRSFSWERNGKFYNDFLKINRWKDLLPQHIGKDGFSKEHLENLSVDYLDEFIMETCRGEWNHTFNCAFVLVLFILNTLPLALILSLCVVLGNLPFALIQRYNRFRLQKVRASILKKQQRAKNKLPSSAVSSQSSHIPAHEN